MITNAMSYVNNSNVRWCRFKIWCQFTGTKVVNIWFWIDWWKRVSIKRRMSMQWTDKMSERPHLLHAKSTAFGLIFYSTLESGGARNLKSEKLVWKCLLMASGSSWAHRTINHTSDGYGRNWKIYIISKEEKTAREGSWRHATLRCFFYIALLQWYMFFYWFYRHFVKFIELRKQWGFLKWKWSVGYI